MRIKSYVTTSIFAGLSIALAACGAPRNAGCTADDAAAQVERLSRDLSAAHQKGRLDDEVMNQIADRMADAGKFYSKTQDSDKYCADIADIRRLAGIPDVAKP